MFTVCTGLCTRPDKDKGNSGLSNPKTAVAVVCNSAIRKFRSTVDRNTQLLFTDRWLSEALQQGGKVLSMENKLPIFTQHTWTDIFISSYFLDMEYKNKSIISRLVISRLVISKRTCTFIMHLLYCLCTCCLFKQCFVKKNCKGNA